MAIFEPEPENEERKTGADLHPRHGSWARSTLIGFVIFLALAGLFVLWIQMRG